MNLSASVWNVVILTSWSFAATTIGVAGVALAEGKTAYAPSNAISHIAFGEGVLQVTKPIPKNLIVGNLFNLSAMIGWSTVAEVAFTVLRVAPVQYLATAGIAATTTVLAYETDFYLVPKRFTPGFDHVISRRGR